MGRRVLTERWGPTAPALELSGSLEADLECWEGGGRHPWTSCLVELSASGVSRGCRVSEGEEEGRSGCSLPTQDDLI
jgi:hypothetical protein